MACQAGLLGTLPPELRQCVYSHLFFSDGDRTVQIEHKSRSDDFFSVMSALPEDFLYIAHFWERRRSAQWPKEIDEAFFQGM